MKNEEISFICTLLQHISEEEVKKIKDIIKDLCSSPYSEMLIVVHESQILKKEYKKETRYSLKKKENRR